MSGFPRNRLRADDILRRWGGEAFLAVAPGASLEGMASLAERMRKLGESARIACRNTTVHATFSISGAFLHRSAPLERLLGPADHDLYVCKDSGRNRTRVTTPERP